MSDKERLPFAQWVFERQLHWITAADVKVGAIVAIDTAMLGGLAAAYSSSSNKTDPAIAASIAAGIFVAMAIGNAAVALYPNTEGPKTSLVFFGKITKRSEPEYQDALRVSTDAQLLDDLGAQIHRNAEIAGIKHKWVTRSLVWSFVAAIPLLIAIGWLVKY